jgi:hypothetical protein
VQQMRPSQVQSSQPQLIWLLPRSFHQSSDSHRPPNNRDTTYNFEYREGPYFQSHCYPG